MIFNKILGIGAHFDHNVWRFRAFENLGLRVRYLDSRPRLAKMGSLRHKLGLAASPRLLSRACAALREFQPDLLWIDTGTEFGPGELATMRAAHSCPFVLYHSDDWLNSSYSIAPSRNAISAYDAHVVPRPVMVGELLLAGAAQVVKSRFSYEPSIHKPTASSLLSRPVIQFIGRADPDRVDLLRRLSERAFPVSAVGPGFPELLLGSGAAVSPDQPLQAEYARVVGEARISLGLLARQSRDQHTCRSVEIPACGGLLVAERTPEHEDMYIDTEESFFFSDVDELGDIASFCLRNEAASQRVAEAGRRRASSSGYDHSSEARRVLDALSGLR